MNLVVYGSLINKNELLRESISTNDVEKVKVLDFQRLFNQEPSYRLLDSQNRAVLNVKKASGFWFNAIIIKNLSHEYFEILDKREKGYTRTYLEKSQVKTYDNRTFLGTYIYLGKKEKESSLIFPNEEYLKICLKGVKTFGEDFHKDFLETTYKNSSRGLVLI